MRRTFASAGIALLLLVLAPLAVHAHAIGVDCTVRGDKIDVEVFYDDDTPASKAKVEVFNQKNELVLTGITDEQGKWSFPTPAAGKYDVAVDGGAGHRAKRTITIAGTASVDGPTRAEFTSTPWIKIGIGLTMIGGCAGAFLLVSFFRRPSPTN